MKIGIDSLSETVAQELSNYSREVNKTLRDEVKTTTKQCVKDIREAAPEDTGAYKKSWTSKVQYESEDDIRTVVYAKGTGAMRIRKHRRRISSQYLLPVMILMLVERRNDW